MNPLDEAGPTRTTAAIGSPALSLCSSDWIVALEQLHDAVSASSSRSRWTIEWAIHRWANEALSQSTAIRIGESEGLSGPAPARWRILAHIDAASGAYSLAVLDGRASRSPNNVLAASISDHCGRTVIAAHGVGLRWLVGLEPSGESDLDQTHDPLELLIDALAAGQLDEMPNLTLDLRLAFALVRNEALTPRPVDQSA